MVKTKKRERGTTSSRRGKRAEKKRSDGEVGVYLSPVMLVMAVAFAAFGMLYEFACSLTAVVLHEFAHAKTAKRLGYALNEVKIMPYGAALCGNADIRPKHEVIIAAAGPCFNLVIALIFAAVWWLEPESYSVTEAFCKCNVYIGVFNLLPVYPLDGGRVAFAALSVRVGRKRAYTITRVVSAVFGVASLALFAVSAVYSLNVCFLTVGVFMVASAFIPDNRARYYALFAASNRSVRLNTPLEKRCYAVSDSVRLFELCKYLDPDRLVDFEVYGKDLNRLCVLGEAELINYIEKYGYEAQIGQVIGLLR